MTRSGRNTIHPKRLKLPLHSSPDAQVQISCHTARRGNSTERRSAAMRHKGHLPFQSRKGIQNRTRLHPLHLRRCRDCDVANGKLKLTFVPDNELCAACRFLHECVGNREKTQAAILRKHCINKEMAPLLDKKVQKQLPNGNNIKVGFDEKGNKHLYSDTMARTRRVSADE